MHTRTHMVIYIYYHTLLMCVSSANQTQSYQWVIFALELEFTVYQLCSDVNLCRYCDFKQNFKYALNVLEYQLLEVCSYCVHILVNILQKLFNTGLLQITCVYLQNVKLLGLELHCFPAKSPAFISKISIFYNVHVIVISAWLKIINPLLPGQHRQLCLYM